MKKKQMIWLRIVVLPVSLFTLIVALDQDQSWLVILAILFIMSIILWWYLDEVNAAKERKVLEDNVLDIASSLGIKNAKMSLIEEDVKNRLLMEKFYQFDVCKIKKTFMGVYDDVSFQYKEVDFQGSKNFVGHVLILFVKGSPKEKVAMYDAFPYNETLKNLTIVGSNEEKLEVSVSDVCYFEERGVVNMNEALQRLLGEIEDILNAIGVTK